MVLTTQLGGGEVVCAAAARMYACNVQVYYNLSVASIPPLPLFLTSPLVRDCCDFRIHLAGFMAVTKPIVVGIAGGSGSGKT